MHRLKGEHFLLCQLSHKMQMHLQHERNDHGCLARSRGTVDGGDYRFQFRQHVPLCLRPSERLFRPSKALFCEVDELVPLRRSCISKHSLARSNETLISIHTQLEFTADYRDWVLFVKTH